MVPPESLRPPAHETDRISESVHAKLPWRKSIRKIPSVRNAWSVSFAYLQTAAVLALPIVMSRWTTDLPLVVQVLPWIAAFFLMGRSIALFSILMHEAAHKLLFAHRGLNDFVGRWLLAYPTFVPFDVYRKAHLAHHRDEMGPEEPDIPLYRGYPIASDSWRRKLVRDITGRTGLRLLKGIYSAAVKGSGDAKRVAWSMLGVQAVIWALFAVGGYWWFYPVFWLLPYLTIWRVLNRLRAVAEHGGMERSKDKRATTHIIDQHAMARFWMVPYATGWHLAHHVDPGIPFRKLPELHDELVEAGYIDDAIVYESYTQLWRTLSSKAPLRWDVDAQAA